MRLGVMFDRDLPPEHLIPFARELDGTTVSDLWVVEDLGWTGGISSAATALAVTSRLRVGLGIAPAPLRNPALLAMEFGNLARLHPGRLAAGIGHGLQSWMRQVGAAVPSPLALLEETITGVRAMLHGEKVVLDGKAVRLDGVALVHPPAEPPPVLAGVLNPKSLALSGRVADGTIIPEGFSPSRVPWVRSQIAAAGPHELVAFTHLYVGDDAEEVARPIVAEYTEFLRVPASEVALAIGDVGHAVAHVRALWAAGVDTVVVRPIGSSPLSHVHAILAQL
ncbi:LLM class flavin-dependent oxidoreductase [Nonomuraea typhae]|uniref:LLM class flavin-dependent oxidoreductase n=1 Tax=Nonomuraea typhae TaxID=2603600 RepID=UPI001FE91DE8|nr:LLM class flavin-dependent oxidoreductase [Nonomuraea typhae]